MALVLSMRLTLCRVRLPLLYQPDTNPASQTWPEQTEIVNDATLGTKSYMLDLLMVQSHEGEAWS